MLKVNTEPLFRQIMQFFWLKKFAYSVGRILSHFQDDIIYSRMVGMIFPWWFLSEFIGFSLLVGVKILQKPIRIWWLQVVGISKNADRYKWSEMGLNGRYGLLTV